MVMLNVVITSVVILFILIFLGFFIGKRQVIRKECIPDLSRFVVSVTMPVTIFCSMVQQDGRDLLGQIWQIMLMALIFHIATWLLGLAIVKALHIPERERGIWTFNFMFSNNGFMGFPLALSIFGNTGLFLMAIANVVSNLLIFSVGLKMVTKHYPVREKISLKKMLVNNINISVVIGFIFYLTQIHLPDSAMNLLEYISNITAGLSMIVVGLSLSRMNLKEVFQNRKMFLMAVFRLLIIPLLVIAVFKVLPIQVPEMLYVIILLMSALPSASAQTMLTEQYGTNTQDAGRAVFLTTLFSVVTIPLVMAVGL